jgi:hypothetical protein
MTLQIFFDPLGGVSGDMFLSSLIDCGVPLKIIETECAKLKLKQNYKLICKKDVNNGFSGKKFFVKIKKGNKWVSPESISHSVKKESHTHHHRKENDKVHHSQPHDNKPAHSHNHYKDIRALIKTSKLSKTVIENSIKVFDNLAKAEAKIHGTKVETVCFHEVGAVDSIIDIVGSCIALDYLKVEKVFSSAITVGSGEVNCAHGKLPLPAPATLELLKGIPVYYSDENKEMCTPTGAALLSSLADFKTKNQRVTPIKTGYGLSHSLPHNAPPYLRATLVECSESKNIVEQLLQINFNLDDMSPEYIAPLYDKLLKCGVLDVHVTPIVMKKGRLAHEICVLLEPRIEESVCSIIFTDTSTFGLKKVMITRESLSREMIKVKTKWGDVRVKKAMSSEYKHKYHIEFEDVKKISEKSKITMKQIITNVEKNL